MSRNVRPSGGNGIGRQPTDGPGGSGSSGNNQRSKDLVTRAYNNNIIVKNEDGEYAPVGMNHFTVK